MKKIIISGAIVAFLGLTSFQSSQATVSPSISSAVKDTVPQNWKEWHKNIKKVKNWENKDKMKKSKADTTYPESKEKKHHGRTESGKKKDTVSYQKNMGTHFMNKQYHPLPPKKDSSEK